MIEHTKTKQKRLNWLREIQLTTMNKVHAMLIGFAVVVIIENIIKW